MDSAFVVLALVIPLYCALSVVYWSWKNGISPTPTSRKQLRAILELIPRPAHGIIIELGSGWGTLALALAGTFTNCTVIGIESSPIPYLASLVLRWMQRRPNLEFRRQDFLKNPLPESYLAVCYLYPGGMKKLQEKLLQESERCVWLISNTFALPQRRAFRVIHCDDIYRSPIYLYRMAETEQRKERG